jgi:hypothetical protein
MKEIADGIFVPKAFNTHTHTHTHGWMHVSNKYIAVIKHEGTILLKELRVQMIGYQTNT